ncbi:MAG TPA: squalene synthase HpnC [Pirellulaceae bacterium]|nr:squalene synthase HpnC [Pirellulaceae bacterium]
MADRRFEADLRRYGPSANDIHVSFDEACSYCRRLASSHYENFSVVSCLLPRNLRQHFCNVYAYCRWADDLADEIGTPSERLALLDWWRRELLDCLAGQARHPVFVALLPTIQQFSIPATPFLDLLEAFERDQRQTRYATHAEVLDYCRCSANPVGHLVLYLGRCYSETNASLSDSVCTGLQLANFLQDVAEDFERGRVYLPQASIAEFGCTVECFPRKVVDDKWRSLMKSEVERASEYLHRGWPLVEQLPQELCFQVDLFICGGLAILQAIRDVDYDVWTARPTVGKLTQLKLAANSWLRQRVTGRRAARDHG